MTITPEKKELLNKITTFEALSQMYLEKLPDFKFFKMDTARNEGQVCFLVDGVSYSFEDITNLWISDDIEKELAKRIEGSCEVFNLVYKRHHAIIKEVYELCSSLYEEKIWAMPSASVPMCIYYGNSKGYIGHLSLSKQKGKYNSSTYKPSFFVEGRRNDNIFAGKFDIKGVKFTSHNDIWGKTEEESKIIPTTTKEVTNPIDSINYMLDKFGNNPKINNNPLTFLLHVFYSYGNGYDLLENNNISFISSDSKDDNNSSISSDSKIKSLEKIYKTQEKILTTLEDKLESSKKEEDKEKLLNEIEETKDFLKDFADIIETVKEKLSNKVQLESLEELYNYDIDTSHPYWEHLEGIVSHYSIATKIPDNLSPEWKLSFDILTSKMNEIDSIKVSKALEKGL